MSYIQIEPTPNPMAVKFLMPDAWLPEGKSVNCSSSKQASISPLGMELFAIMGVENVFFGHDFLTITKDVESDWEELSLLVITTVMNFLITGLPLLKEFSFAQQSVLSADPLVVQIEAILEEKIRPAIAQDGGNILFRGFEDGIVYVELQGSCSGCPSSAQTLKMGIENMLKYYVPEVLMVEQI
jgi:Fe-S cluster biogenesis protein NfuA